MAQVTSTDVMWGTVRLSPPLCTRGMSIPGADTRRRRRPFPVLSAISPRVLPMKRGSRHKKAPRGGVPQNVVKRGSTAGQRSADKRVRQQVNKDQEGRRRAALEATRLERERLEARLAREAEQPVEGKVAGAEWAADLRTSLRVVEECEVETPAPVTVLRPRRRPAKRWPVPPEATGERYTMGEARQMLRKGYHLLVVMERTGWGFDAFDGMFVDQDGYGMPLEFELSRLDALPSATPWS